MEWLLFSKKCSLKIKLVNQFYKLLKNSLELHTSTKNAHL